MRKLPIDYARPVRAPRDPLPPAEKWARIVFGLVGAALVAFVVLLVMHWRSLGADWAP